MAKHFIFHFQQGLISDISLDYSVIGTDIFQFFFGSRLVQIGFSMQLKELALIQGILSMTKKLVRCPAMRTSRKYFVTSLCREMEES